MEGDLPFRLQDGTIRLVRAQWLLSAACPAVMPRRQELPEEAFCSADEASERLRRGDRSIIALSYGWLTAAHPDPHGQTLAALRQHLRSSIPQTP